MEQGAVSHEQARLLRTQRFQESEHRLLQLGIHLICNGRHVEHHNTEIDVSQIVMEGYKNAYLQNSKFFHYHGDSVALRVSQNSVLACRAGNGDFGIGSEAKAADEVDEQQRKMARGVLV